MSDLAAHKPAKPGTACLACRRRKLRCSREPAGCDGCARLDLPCVYPAPETGLKKKRGPYKKDKPARERHLEDLVKYLEPKSTTSPGTESNASSGHHSIELQSSNEFKTEDILRSIKRASATNGNSEDLVKDALIALTGSCVSERESRQDNGNTTLSRHAPSLEPSSVKSRHPPIRKILEYWHLFVTRVDPVTKLIHCPTFGNKLFEHIDNLDSAPPSMEALIFSIYFIVIGTCTASETRARFGESREVLMLRYAQKIEAGLSDNYRAPVLESLQALVLYLIGIRRKDDGTNVRALFALAVHMAHSLGVNKESGTAYSPYETQLRRRLWWQMCGLESRGAEENTSKAETIMANHDIQKPDNLNDFDLDPILTQTPASRIGITHMTFVLAQFLQHLDVSRPYDWLCASFVHGMLIKARLLIDFPQGLIPTKSMTIETRKRLLRDSVDIIRGTHALAHSDLVPNWSWFFKGYIQWHSLAIVVTELAWSTNKSFKDSAWAALDPILDMWDSMYRSKRDEPAWDHVNGLIERARQLRSGRATQADVISTALAPMLPHHTALTNTSTGTNGSTFSAPELTQPETITQMSASTAQQHNTHQCGPTSLDFDIDFNSLEGLDDIDFQAFDEVFNSGGWEWADPLGDVNMQFG